jgi:hypothetical protein
MQPEKPAAVGTATFSLSSPHAVLSEAPKQTPNFNEFTPLEEISSLHSDSAERPRSKPKTKHTASGVVLLRIC